MGVSLDVQELLLARPSRCTSPQAEQQPQACPEYSGREATMALGWGRLMLQQQQLRALALPPRQDLLLGWGGGNLGSDIGSHCHLV